MTSIGAEIRSSEQGVIRLFAVDLPPDEAAHFNRRNGTWPLRAALGADWLDPDHLLFFDIADLDGVGLTEYLAEGHGIGAEELAPLRQRLDGMKGHALIVTSRAFGGRAQTIKPRAPLRLVATLHEDRPPVIFERLPSDAATRPGAATTGDSATTPARPGRKRRLILALLVLGLVALTLLAVLT
ncbi:hypothetical protein [Aquicoccus porphyridii]|uniref:hypothetical protein n=1 Tax=Aquicoccus porphyridii TaxID=1852029 RepID=UPI00273D690C|nr:hypothetical protein [Aquicoccus porphyridii]